MSEGDKVQVKENLIWSERRGHKGVIAAIYSHREERWRKGVYEYHPFILVTFEDGNQAIFEDDEIRPIDG